MTTALAAAAGAVLRSGDTEAVAGLHDLVDTFGADTAARILTSPDEPRMAARLSVRLRDVLDQRGGAITHPHLVQYLTALLSADHTSVRAVIDDEVAAGAITLVWADPRHGHAHTLALPERA